VRTALTRDIVVVVAEGYGSFFSALKEIGNVIMLVTFQMTASLWLRLWGGGEECVDMEQLIPILLGSVCFFPVILVFLWLRRDVTTHYLDEYMAGFKKMTTVVEDVANNYPLIASYNMRPAAADEFTKTVKGLNKNMINMDSVLQNNMFFPVWVATGFQGMWLVVGGMMVINQGLKLGMFLAGLRTIVKLGTSMTILFKNLHNIENIMPCLLRIARIMNLPTELPARKELSDKFRKETTAFQDMLHKHFEQESVRLHVPFVDMLPIVVDNLEYKYTTGARSVTFNFKGFLQANQGELLCLAGQKGNGMSTLIRIIGLEIYNLGSDATSGFFVPSHLRSLHVSNALFVPGTLRENLTFGVRFDSNDGSEERVKAICKKLLITDDVMTHYNDVLPWAEVLSETQTQLISLARAIIANPDLLCLHKPTQILTSKYATAVMDILREFVDHRGVNEDPEQRRFRRPRTIIMSSKHPEILLRADRVYKIGTSGEIVELQLREDAHPQ
jgi:ABC-type multidrug transport system fused ATPase/permease subunit